jgi:hypothetical protein
MPDAQNFTRYFLPVYRPTRQDQLGPLLLMYIFCPAARQGPDRPGETARSVQGTEEVVISGGSRTASGAAHYWYK